MRPLRRSRLLDKLGLPKRFQQLSGQATVEYIILISLIVIGLSVVMFAFKENVADLWETTNDTLIEFAGGDGSGGGLSGGDSPDPESDPEIATSNNSDAAAYAILTVDEDATASAGETRYNMTFVRSAKALTTKNTYNGKEIIAVYTGFEDVNPSSPSDLLWHMDGATSSISSVYFKNTIRPTSTAYWFNGMSNCTSIDAVLLSCSNITTGSMESMFFDCISLESLALPQGFGAETTTANMSFMFTGCSSLTTLDLPEGFGESLTSADLSFMFYGCSAIGSLDLSDLNALAATDMSNMFTSMDALEKVALGEKFSFMGDGSTCCTLPNGYWVASDNVIYSSSDLANSYDGSTMADTYYICHPGSLTVTYDANGGTGNMSSHVVEYGQMIVLQENGFTREGYTFAGWSKTPDGAVEYIDEQQIVNLQTDGVMNLYAVWVENSYTVTFDYTGGSGTTTEKQVVQGEPYGTLPTYPTKAQHLFTGWYTDPEGGTEVTSSTIVGLTENHTLYAQWSYTPANNVIQDLVIKNNADENHDGVVDAYSLTFKCSSSFEKLNVPLEGLEAGQTYRLSFTESNNAIFGDNEKGYGGAIYGSIITAGGTLSSSSIKTESIADGGLIAQWSDKEKGNEWLNGPRDWEMTFVAEANTMYWTWDFGLIQDGEPYDYNYTDIVLELVTPEIEFDNKTLVLHASSNAQILNDTSSVYATNFVFDGASYAETLYYPITGLNAGMSYTITFKHKFTGSLIDSSLYDYGCGIMNEVPTKYGSYMDDLGTWASNIFIMSSVSGNTETVTLTFTATGNTAYWVWNLANASDSVNCTIDVKVIKLTGGGVTYYAE